MTEHKQSLRELLAKPGLYPRNTIIAKKRLAPKIYEMEVYAPLAIHNALPGQFVNVIVHEHGKSVPLTIADSDEKTGILTLVFQAVGVSTMRMAALEVGDTLYSIRGPLGVPSEVEKTDKLVLVVAGGVGIAPMYPVIRAHHAIGNNVYLIMGAREESLLFWEDKVRPFVKGIIVCTDIGHKRDFEGSVVIPMKNSLAFQVEDFSHVLAAGPLPLLRAIADITKERNVKYIASAVAMMVDGTGMCFGCQCKVNGATKLICRDGPEIDGNGTDWQTLSLRLNQFRSQEAVAWEEFKKTDLYQKYLAQEEVPL